MDERLKAGQLHETPVEHNEPDTYPEAGDMSDAGHMASYNSPKTTRAADEGSSATLRAERTAKAESGGYDDPRYGKVRSFPEQS